MAGGRPSSRAQKTGRATGYTIPGMAVPCSRGRGSRISAAGLRCQLPSHSRERSLQIGVGVGRKRFFIFIILNVSFGGGRRRKPYTCPFSRDEEGEFKPHLGGLILGRKQ